MRIILAAFLMFTTSSAINFAWAEVPVAAIQIAEDHCRKLVGKVTQPIDLVESFGKQPSLDIDKKMSVSEKAEIISYLEGRKDIPSFEFLVPKFWRVATRDQQIKFNSAMSLVALDKLKFNPTGYPFSKSCVAGKISTDGDDNFSYAIIPMLIAFDTKEVSLTYKLARQKNYSWYMDDLMIGTESLKETYSEKLNQIGLKNGFDASIILACKSVSAPLKCQ